MATLQQPPDQVVAMEAYREDGILYTDFTDNTDATGTYTSQIVLPADFYIERCVLVNLVGFTGDTSAAITVGDGTDVDRLHAGTPSVLASLAALDLGVPSGTTCVATAFSPVCIVTGAADFTSIAAGGFDLVVYGWMVD
jgi:hypothetical protein